MGFRLNPKWVFSVHQHFPSSSSSSSSPSSSSSLLSLPFHYSLTVRIPEAAFVSTRSSFLSSINEEDGVRRKDPLKVCVCASATQYVTENVYIELKDPKVNIDVSSVGEQRFSAAKARLSCSLLQYNLLMKNLFALEEAFVASDSLRLEKDIMLHLGRLGALELFNSCLSRARSSSNASCLLDVGENSLRANARGRDGEVVVSSRRKLEKETRRASEKVESSDHSSSSTMDSRTMWNNFLSQDAPTTRRSSKSRKKRAAISRNEAEMSTGVKIVADLERIRTKLEEESGKVASLSCWAEAAGMNKKLLLRNLHFGWYCRDELLKSTRSLVLFLARNYRGLGIAHEDLIQAGNVGVLQGAKRFDHTRGYKFSTYVQYWIRKSMSMMVSQHARGIHIPPSINRTMNKIQKARKTLKTRHGIKYPGDEEIAKLTGFSLKKIRAADQCLRVVGSIDQKVGDCISSKFLELTPDTTIECPEETVMRQSARRDIQDLLEQLEPREKQVMILRYGLGDYRPKSLEEIGRLLRVSKEWIRRIERRAMAKLRDQPAAGDLRYYLDR